MQEAQVNISDTFGLWERSLIAWPDGSRDTTTTVAWLQGPSLFADLRQPANAPWFDGVSCLNDLRPRHFGWLARQEGFAGRLVCAGNAFEWRRAVDFQCPSASADAGYLKLSDGMLVEQGRDVPYIEHWHRASPVGSPHIAMQMRDEHGRVGFLVRAGEIFMYVRDREVLLPPGGVLKDLVDAANPEAARALLDCEISLGSVHGSAWLIERSSLPYRVGDDLAPSFSTDERDFTANDVSAAGETCLRHWTVVDLDVDNQRQLLVGRDAKRRSFSPYMQQPGEAHDQAFHLTADVQRIIRQFDLSAKIGERSMNTAGNFSSIPVVDVTKLLAGTPSEQKEIADDLGKAARGVGFVYITGGGVPETLFEGVVDATKRFFALPYEEKMKVYIGHSRCHRGYVPEGEEVFASGTKDKKEAYDLAIDLPADDVDYVAGNPLLGPNQWPNLPGFAEAVDTYYTAVFGLGRILLRGFAMAIGEEPTFFDRYVTKPPSQLRLVHYPVDTGAEDRPGIGAHTDYECFTLLRSTSPGLEVMNGAGEWIDAPPLPGAFIVNIGDMMEIWTNGEFAATSHRVRKVSEERYSFPLFFAADYDTVVAPLPRFAGNSNVERRALKAGEHIFAQTMQSFTYLKERRARGEIVLPEGSTPLSSFGQEARQKY